MDTIIRNLPKMIASKNKHFFQENFESFNATINQTGFNLIFYLKNKTSVTISIKDRDMYFNSKENPLENFGIPLRAPT